MIQMNLVLIQEGSLRVEKPALMSYNDSILYIYLPDTVEAYEVKKITEYHGDVIIGIKRGIVLINPHFVYFKHYNSTRELYFTRDNKEWARLKKRKSKKTTKRTY